MIFVADRWLRSVSDWFRGWQHAYFYGQPSFPPPIASHREQLHEDKEHPPCQRSAIAETV